MKESKARVDVLVLEVRGTLNSNVMNTKIVVTTNNSSVDS